MHRFYIATWRTAAAGKGRKIRRWCNRASINERYFIATDVDTSRIRFDIERMNALAYIGGRTAEVHRAARPMTGRDRFFIFIDRGAITRFRAVIDNAYLGPRGLLYAFGITFHSNLASIPSERASERKIVQSCSIESCSINRFDQQTRIPRRSRCHSA